MVEELITQTCSEEPYIIFEKERIILPFGERILYERILYNCVTQLQKEVSDLKQQLEQITFRRVSNDVAKKEIVLLLKLNKMAGSSKVSIIDIVERLHLPAEQIEAVLDDLEKAELISESK